MGAGGASKISRGKVTNNDASYELGIEVRDTNADAKNDASNDRYVNDASDDRDANNDALNDRDANNDALVRGDASNDASDNRDASNDASNLVILYTNSQSLVNKIEELRILDNGMLGSQRPKIPGNDSRQVFDATRGDGDAQQWEYSRSDSF